MSEDAGLVNYKKSKIDFPKSICAEDVMPLIKYLSRTGNCGIRYSEVYSGYEPQDTERKPERYLKEVQGWITRMEKSGLIQALFSLRRDMKSEDIGYFNGLDFVVGGLDLEHLPQEDIELWDSFRQNIKFYFEQREFEKAALNS